MAYNIRYSDYITPAGPPDPERWVGPPGPTGPMGPQGEQGEQGAPGNPFPEAPSDGAIYGRGGSAVAWVPTLPLSGGAIGGPLTLAANATQPMHAVPLQQVNSAISGGGTITGPLMITATGGTVARSMQNRAADVANVLDYGADPTGAADSSAAFNAAASHTNPVTGQRVSVHAPAGKYRINHQVSLANGQSLLGDGPGVTTLYISDQFDHSATSVIVCTASVIDPGPTISDLMFWFEQPTDAASRSTFKTLASGGTSHNGGTGVQYPWAIATQGNCGRIIVRNVNIDGSWNGIEANGACFWIDGLRICSLNIGISIGGTSAAPVADWAHLSDIEFWAFGLNTTALQSIYMDGNTIAMQIGAQNGLEAQNISCFQSQVVFTSDAQSGWFRFTNLSMDSDKATITVNACFFLQITNLYYTSGAGATKPGISVSGGRSVIVNNLYAHSTSPQPLLSVTGGDVTVMGAYLEQYNTTVNAITVASATLRVNDIKIYPGTGSAYSAPLIAQNSGGALQVDNLDTNGAGGSSGIAVQYNVDYASNILGKVALGPGWQNSAPYGNPPLGNYGAVVTAPLDASSIQTGGNAFLRLAATQHLDTAYGYLALNRQTNAGTNNTAIGSMAGYSVTTGMYNTFVGAVAGGGAGPITGGGNTCLGADSGSGLTTGQGNTFVGSAIGQMTTTGSGNIYIGTGLNNFGYSPTETNVFRLGGSTWPVLRATAINTDTPNVFIDTLAKVGTYANDAAAAAGGVAVGQLYRNGSAVMCRIA